MELTKNNIFLTEEQYSAIRKASRPLLKASMNMNHVNRNIYTNEFAEAYAELLSMIRAFNEDLFRITGSHAVSSILEVSAGKAVLTKDDINDLFKQDFSTQNESAQ